MRTSQLLLTGLDITEDEYNYKGQFILFSGNKSKSIEIEDLDSKAALADIITFFNIEDSADVVRLKLMGMVMEKAVISSKIKEGEDL